MAGNRNRYVAKQLRAALRRSRFDAWTIARRAGVSRSTMARVLVGDPDVSWGNYEQVAEQLRLNIEFTPWRESEPVPGPVPTVVDLVRARLRA